MAQSRILICDDEEGLRAAIGLVLDQDYELTYAVDGEQALAMVDQQPIDLVLLDIKMPKLDGLEVLRRLMTRPSPPRVLMLTAYQSVELAERATQAGAVGYVTKPFERKALLESVQRALQGPPSTPVTTP